MNDRVERIQFILEALNLTKYELAKNSGLAASNLKKMFDREQAITDKTLNKIVSAYPQINLDWLKTGEGEMFNPTASKSQTVGSGIGLQGNVGHDVTQMNNSEKLFEDFISGLKSQNKLIEKLVDQNTKAMEQTSIAMSQTDKLITIIQNNLNK